MDENVVTIIETWETMDSLQAHLGTPHMSAFFEKEKKFVEASTLNLLQEAQIAFIHWLNQADRETEHRLMSRL